MATLGQGQVAVGQKLEAVAKPSAHIVFMHPGRIIGYGTLLGHRYLIGTDTNDMAPIEEEPPTLGVKTLVHGVLANGSHDTAHHAHLAIRVDAVVMGRAAVDVCPVNKTALTRVNAVVVAVGYDGGMVCAQRTLTLNALATLSVGLQAEGAALDVEVIVALNGLGAPLTLVFFHIVDDGPASRFHL